MTKQLKYSSVVSPSSEDDELIFDTQGTSIDIAFSIDDESEDDIPDFDVMTDSDE